MFNREIRKQLQALRGRVFDLEQSIVSMKRELREELLRETNKIEENIQNTCPHNDFTATIYSHKTLTGFSKQYAKTCKCCGYEEILTEKEYIEFTKELHIKTIKEDIKKKRTQH